MFLLVTNKAYFTTLKIFNSLSQIIFLAKTITELVLRYVATPFDSVSGDKDG